MANDGLEIQGLDTMQKKLDYIADRYPYESEILLTKVGNKFKKAVIDKTPEGANKINEADDEEDIKKKQKRKLKKSYRV